ncbi:DUF3300 domain-containing protein [Oxalobacter sp. OttesenSCG-928-P03]|nr:DUF3300 domain-containing protein [Oxalobacter sp. OttesenSCG-928-P03]
MKNMRMKESTFGGLFLAGLSLVFLCFVMLSPARAETISTASLKKNYTNAELDQMLAPIALYPDALLIQVLMAATSPSDVSKAAKWLNANPELSGDDAIEAAADFDWSPAVTSLLAFPDVLSTMSSNMGWTVKLGNAFKVQREDVMDRVQHLRRQARATGNLESDDHMNVVRTGNSIAIEPASREVVYVPYYDPAVVYGSWWWPGYVPYYWRPWRGYAYYPGYYSSGFMWGSGIWFSYTRFYGRPDWRRRHIHWNSPPRHPAGHARPGSRPRPGPGYSRPGRGVSSHVRPGYGRPAGTIKKPPYGASHAYRPGREGAGHKGFSGPGYGQRQGSAHRRPDLKERSSRDMSYRRSPVQGRSSDRAHARSSNVAARSSGDRRQAGAVSREPYSRPSFSQPASGSRHAAPGRWGGAGTGRAGRH